MSYKVKFAQGYLSFRLKKAFQNRKMYQDLAIFMRTRVYQNTKRGYYGGVKKNLAKFKPLSTGYIEMRKQALKGKQKENAKGLFGKKRKASVARKKAIAKNFGPFFSPKKSNLTMSGEMQEALDFKFDAKQQTFSVFVKNSTRSDDSGLTNKQLAKKVSDDGRPFPTIDVRGVNTIIRKVQAEIRRSLKGQKRR